MLVRLHSDIDAIIQSLTLEEKTLLLAGKDFWETVPVLSKGVPAIKVWILGESLPHVAIAAPLRN